VGSGEVLDFLITGAVRRPACSCRETTFRPQGREAVDDVLDCYEGEDEPDDPHCDFHP